MDHEVSEGVAQQKARRDVDVELGDSLAGTLDIPLLEDIRALLHGAIVALPTLQRRFVESEEDTLSIEFNLPEASCSRR